MTMTKERMAGLKVAGERLGKNYIGSSHLDRSFMITFHNPDAYAQLHAAMRILRDCPDLLAHAEAETARADAAEEAARLGGALRLARENVELKAQLAEARKQKTNAESALRAVRELLRVPKVIQSAAAYASLERVENCLGHIVAALAGKGGSDGG